MTKTARQFCDRKEKDMKLKLALLLTAFSLFFVIYAAPPVEEGKAIFTTRCAGCHNIHKTLTGPSLAGVDQRRSIEWIVNFVHSSQTVIKNGDKDAVALFEKFNKIPMPDHNDLTDGQIKNVVEFIKSEASVAKAEATQVKKEATTKSFLPITFKNDGYMISFFGAFALLIGVIIFAMQVNRYKRNYFAQKRL
ncbi:MAG: cytochrome c [Sphingobacteriales bacterium]|nr:MAG: cytochrome c [Sphingobacteriales bacterium]